MNILFISNLYPPNQVGGYEELCWEVASNLHTRGHEVSVLTSPVGGKSSRWDRQKIFQSLRLLTGRTVYDGFSGPNYLRETYKAHSRRALFDCIKDVNPDVIYCWNLYGLDVSFFHELGKCKIPIVTMLTDNWLASMLNPEFVGKYFKEGVYGSRSESDMLRSGNSAQELPPNVSAIFGADYMRNFYAAAGVKFARSSIVHNGVCLPDVIPEPRQALSKPVKKIRLLFAGRMVEVKGAHTAIEALGQLEKLRPDIDWHLSMVGDDRDADYAKRLKDIEQKSGVKNKIDYLGHVSPDALPALFDAHDIYLFPSLYEPFSLTLIHALASGIPTVASRVGGNTEIVKEGQTGLLFEKGDAVDMAEKILFYVDKPHLVTDYSASAIIEARGFHTDRMISKMEKYLEAEVARYGS